MKCVIHTVQNIHERFVEDIENNKNKLRYQQLPCNVITGHYLQIRIGAR